MTLLTQQWRGCGCARFLGKGGVVQDVFFFSVNT